MCEGWHLKEWVVREFARLSNEEVLFRTQAQSTGHESLARGHPDRFSMYYKILRSDRESLDAKDKAMEEILNKASEAWLQTNASLFKHILDYKSKLNAFLDKAGGWIREQEERIWTTMFQITGDIGAPLCASLDVLLHLLETLPSFPANLSYQSQSPIICGFAPEAYAQPWLGLHSLNLPHTPSFNGCRKAEDILKEAIIPQYRRWCSHYSKDGSVRLHFHSTHTDLERGQNPPVVWSSLQFSICCMLSIQMQTCQVPFSTALAVRLLFFWQEFGIRVWIKRELFEFIGIKFWVWQWQWVPRQVPS